MGVSTKLTVAGGFPRHRQGDQLPRHRRNIGLRRRPRGRARPPPPRPQPSSSSTLRRLLDACRLYDGVNAEIPLTQEELVQLAGTSRATVNKVLREMEQRGALELRRGRVVILDPDVLRHRSGPA